MCWCARPKIFLLFTSIAGILVQGAAVSPSLTVAYNVREDASIGDIVTTFSAMDPNSLGVQFSLQSPSSEFDIDASTGILTVAAALDYETDNVYQLTVVATDGAMPAQSDLLNVTINIIDINEDPPELNILSQTQTNVLAPPGTVVATFQCLGGDPDGAFTITYSIIDSSSQFSIDSGTGIVSTLSLATLPTSIANASYPVTVICTKDPLSLSSSIDVSLEVTNADVIEPAFIRSLSITTHFSVREDASIGTFVGSYSATDSDSPELVFSLIGTIAFTIDPETGVIVVAEALDYEMVSSYSVTVTVTEVRIVPGTPQSESLLVSISIINLNEYPPVFTQTDVNPVGEDSFSGTIAGRFRCTDGDPNRSAQMRYSISDPSGQFVINSITGDVTTSGSLIQLDVNSLSESYAVTVTCTEAFDAPFFSASTTATITVEKEDNTPPDITTTDTEFSVREDAPVGTTIVTITAVDPDSVGIQFSIVDGTGTFTINETTGMVQVNAPLDYETVTSYEVRAVATEIRIVSGAPQTDSLLLTIDIEDINEQIPVFTQIDHTRMTEQATPGTLIGLVQCIDTDPNLNTPIVYSLDDPSGQFQIDATIGVIRIVDSGLLPVDVNTYVANYTVIATCTEDQDPFFHNNATIVLEITKVDNIAPTITTNDIVYSVRESATIGENVTVISAADPDSSGIRFSLEGDGATAFNIDAVSGAIQVGIALDYENITTYQVTVIATEIRVVPRMPQNDFIILTINIIDINDEPPIFTQIDTIQVTENSTQGTIVAAVQCMDQDELNSPVIYSLDDPSGQFLIDSNVGTVTTTTLTPVDVNTFMAIFNITVFCTETQAPFLQVDTMLLIEITKVDLNPPTIITAQTEYRVSENASIGDTVLSVSAIDTDSADIQFSLAGTAAAAFSITPDTGIIQVVTALDFESITSYQATVTVTEVRIVPGIPQTDSIDLTISITNFNDEPPIFIQRDVIAISVSSTPGAVVARTMCMDGDTGMNSNITYSLSDPSGQFSIDSDGNVVTVSLNAIDVNTVSAFYNIIVTCTESDPPFFATNTSLTLQIDNEDTIPPTITTTVTVYNVSESAEIGYSVADIDATDIDSPGLEFSLIGISLFTINPSTGVLQVGGQLDFETVRSYQLTVVATEVRFIPGLPQTDSINITINVENVNELPPEITRADVIARGEESPPGTVVANIECRDGDLNINAPVTLSFIDPSNQFTIDSTSGDITTVSLNPIDTNVFIAEYSVTVICTEVESPSFSTNITLSLEIFREDSIPPNITTLQTVYMIRENASIGDVITTITATDPDSSSIQFSLQGTGVFTIDETSGVLAVGAPLDYETVPSYQFTVTATEVRVVPGLPQTDSINITINIENLNELPPEFTQVRVIQRGEESPPGTVVATVECRDGDFNINAPVELSLIDPSNQFIIDSTNGNITTVSLNPVSIDIYIQEYPVTAVCTETETPTFTTSISVILEIRKEDSIPPVITTLQTVYTVRENASIGDVVTAITATDPDSSSIQFSLQGTGVFTIDETSGVLAVGAPLDYETVPSYQFTVTATEVRVVPGLPQTDSINITINIENLNELPPEFTQVRVIQRGEESPPGTVVATVECRDGDLNINAPVELSLFDPSNQFIIDSTNGNITTVSLNPVSIDIYIQEYPVTVVCTETETPTFTTSISLILEIRKEDSIPPVITTLQTVYNVRENASIGDVVATITATDPDSSSIQFSLQGTGVFTIDETSGVLAVGAPLDYETVPSYQFTVTATEVRVVPGLPQTDSINITINIENLNELPPEFTQVRVIQRGEESPPGTVVATVECRDGDLNINAAVELSLIDPSNQFTIDNTSGNITTVTLNPVDINIYIQMYQVTVICTETTYPSFFATTSLSLEITKEDNIPPNITTSDTVFSVREDAPIGSLVGTITAIDPDSSGVEYSLQGIDAFTIDEVSGIIEVQAPLDYETVSSYQFTVLATEVRVAPGPAQNDSRIVNINIENVNELPPVITEVNTETISELSSSGTVVGIVECRDGDININTTVEFSLTDPSGQFSIDNSTGEITTVTLFPVSISTYIQEYTVTVLCTENQSPFFMTDTVVTLKVANEDTIQPEIAAVETMYSVREDVPIGYIVAGFSALDPDSPAIEFSLEGMGAAAFTIDPDTGVLQVGAPLDYENITSYLMIVVASEVRVVPGTPQRDFLMITVNIENVNEFPPVLEEIDQRLLSEGAPPGTLIAAVLCVDGDPNLNAPIEYSLDDPSNQFFINSSTGDILTATLDPLNSNVAFFTSFIVSINCTERQEPFFTTNLIITLLITREDTIPPSITTVETIYSVSESASVGDVVTVITANDPDSAGVQFSLQGTGASDFTINPDTGVLSVGAMLDRENTSSYLLRVVASEDKLFAGMTQSGFLTITINVEDINDNSPSCGGAKFETSIQAGTYDSLNTVYDFSCTDRDIGQNAIIEYTILRVSPSVPGNRFIINGSSLNFGGKVEKSEIYILSVNVADQGVPRLSADIELSINIIANEDVSLSSGGIAGIVIILIVFLVVLLILAMASQQSLLVKVQKMLFE